MNLNIHTLCPGCRANPRQTKALMLAILAGPRAVPAKGFPHRDIKRADLPDRTVSRAPGLQAARLARVPGRAFPVTHSPAPPAGAPLRP